MAEQLRTDFSDYPAKEQEADVERHNKQVKQVKLIRHAYLMKIDGEWAHFIISPKMENIDFYDDKKLIDVCEILKRKFPDYQPRVIMNEGLENYLRDRRPEIIKKRRYKQLTINFKGESNGRD